MTSREIEMPFKQLTLQTILSAMYATFLRNNLTNIALTFKLTQIHVLGRHVVSYRSTVATGVWILILLRSAAAFYITFSMYCSNNLEGKTKNNTP